MSQAEFEDLDQDDLQQVEEIDDLAEADLEAEPLDDESTLGEVSEESREGRAPTESVNGSSRFAFLQNMTIYDGMLVASAVCIGLSIVLLAMELLSFGFGAPWRTSEALVAPITPP